MDDGAVLFSKGRLNAPFCHHGIGITDPELGGKKNTAAFFRGKESCRNSGSPASKDQDIHIMVRMVRKSSRGRDAASRFENIGYFLRNNCALVGADLKSRLSVRAIVRVIRGKETQSVLWRKGGGWSIIEGWSAGVKGFHKISHL
jgi:hypothetical protein